MAGGLNVDSVSFRFSSGETLLINQDVFNLRRRDEDSGDQKKVTLAPAPGAPQGEPPAPQASGSSTSAVGTEPLTAAVAKAAGLVCPPAKLAACARKGCTHPTLFNIIKGLTPDYCCEECENNTGDHTAVCRWVDHFKAIDFPEAPWFVKVFDGHRNIIRCSVCKTKTADWGHLSCVSHRRRAEDFIWTHGDDHIARLHQEACQTLPPRPVVDLRGRDDSVDDVSSDEGPSEAPPPPTWELENRDRSRRRRRSRRSSPAEHSRRRRRSAPSVSRETSQRHGHGR